MQDHVGVKKMSKIYDNSITRDITSKIILQSLQKEQLCFFLAETDENYVTTENTQQSKSDVSSIGYVESINPGDIKLVSPVPAGSHPNWRVGTNFRPGYYSSSNLGRLTTKNSQPYWVIKSNSGPDLIALVVGFSGVQNNKAKIEGMSSPQHELGVEAVDGSIQTNSDGIDYCIIGAVPEGAKSYVSNKYIALEDSVIIDNNLDKYSGTSVKGEASSICGPGKEQKCGTCCLYHKEGGYDSIKGATFSSGNLYKCLESKCYECVEIARSLNKKYLFNMWRGEGATTGTGGRCYECNDHSITSNSCGPCPCTIDYNEKSFYQDIINNKNIPVTSSADVTARLTEYGENNLSGAVSSLFITLPPEKEKRKMASYYVDRPDLWVVPLEGDGTSLAEVRITTETNGTDVFITGIEKPTEHGFGYSNIRVREDEWNNMFPELSVNDIEINLLPIGGPAKMISSILPTAVMIQKTIQKTDVAATTDQKTFNRYGICKLFEEGFDKINALSGKAAEEKIKINPSVKINFQNTDGTQLLASNTFGGESSSATEGVSSGQGGGGKGGYGAALEGESSASGQSYRTDKIIKTSLKNIDNTTVSAEIKTKSLTEYKVGGQITDSDGTKYDITQVIKPTSVSGNNIDLYKTEVLTRNVSPVDFNKMQQDSMSITYEIILG